MLHPGRQRGHRAVGDRRARDIAQDHDVVGIEASGATRAAPMAGGRHIEAGRRQRPGQVMRALGSALDVQHPRARPDLGNGLEGVVGREGITGNRQRSSNHVVACRIDPSFDRNRRESYRECDLSRRHNRVVCPQGQRARRGVLRAHGDCRRKRCAGGDSLREIDAIDPGISQRTHGHRLDEDWNVRSLEPRDRILDAASGLLAVAEQHDTRSRIGRELATCSVERSLQIGSRFIDLLSCRVDRRRDDGAPRCPGVLPCWSRTR